MKNNLIKITLLVCLFISFSTKLLSYDKSYLSNIQKKIALEKDELKKALLYEEISWTFRDDSVNFAKENGLIALKIYESNHDLVGICRIYNKLGILSRNSYNYKEAIEYYNKVISLANTSDNSFNLELGHAYNNLANIYYDVDDFPLTSVNLNKAKEFFKKANDKEGLAYNYNLFGFYYNNINEYTKSKDYHNKALELRLEAGNFRRASESYVNLANCYLRINDFDSTLICLNKAKFYFETLKEGESSRINYYFGKFYLKIQKFDDAFSYFLKSRNANNNKSYKEKSTIELVKIYAQKKDYKQLYKYQQELDLEKHVYNLKQETKYQVDIYNYEKKKKANQLEIDNKNLAFNNQLKLDNQRFIFRIISILLILISVGTYFIWRNYRKVNQYNQILFETNKEINKKEQSIEDQNQELLQLNKTKDYFFSYIANDLQNPFNTILNLTNDASTSGANQEIILKQINSTAKIAQILLENINEWAKLQSDKINYNPNTINLQQIVNQNINTFINIIDIKNIHFENEINAEIDIFADAFLTNSIFKNLILNIIQSLNNNSHFKVNALQNEKKVNVNFIFDESEDISKIIEIFNQPSSNNNSILQSTSDFGLIICKAFVEKNNGMIEVEHIKSLGNIISIMFPSSSFLENKSSMN